MIENFMNNIQLSPEGEVKSGPQERALRIVCNRHLVENSHRLNCANLPALQNTRLQDLSSLSIKLNMVWCCHPNST